MRSSPQNAALTPRRPTARHLAPRGSWMWRTLRLGLKLINGNSHKKPLTDPATGLRNLRGLIAAGQQLVQEVLDQARPVSLTVIDFSDLVEVRSLYDLKTGRQLTARVLREIKSFTRRGAMVARTGRTQFTVLMPGVGRDAAWAIIHDVLGNPGRIEFEAADSEIVLVPDIVMSCAATPAATVDGLYREAVTNMRRMRAEERRRQQHLKRERQRRSRPMGLMPMPSEPLVRPQPMPLAGAPYRTLSVGAIA